MRAELGHLVCYSWNRGCPCRSEELLHSKGTATALGSSCCCHGSVLCTHQVGAPGQSLLKRLKRTVAAGHSTQSPVPLPGLCRVSPHVPALVTKPRSARLRNRNQQCTEPDFCLQPLPKAQLPPGPAAVSSQGSTSLGTAADLLCCPTHLLAQHTAPVAAPANAGLEVTHSTGFPCPWQVLLPVILEAAQNRRFMTREDKENSHQGCRTRLP